MVFRVTVRDPAGTPRKLVREAESRDELLARLRAEGHVVLGLDADLRDDALPGRWHPAWLRPMTGFDVEMGLRQLASMLRSGVTLLKAVATVEEQSVSPWGRLAWMRVRQCVFQGGAFAEALARQPRRFGEIVVRLCEVGERAGELERAVTRAADQLEARRNLRTQVVNALVYPFIAVAMAVGVSAYLVVAVIPKVADFLRSGGATLPAMTQMLMDFADWVNGHAFAILAWAGFAVAAWFVVRLNAAGRERQDALLLRVPVTGGILRLSGTALFARSMQIMIESGVTLIDALATAGRLLGNRRLRRRVLAAREGVVNGRALAESLASAREFMPMLRRMAAVGETTGALAETFGETADFHEMQLAVAIKRFGLLIEPVMICITGGIVGFVYVAFFMAIFAMAGTS